MDFDRHDVLRTILENKLPHLSMKFWKKSQKSIQKGTGPFTFDHLMSLFQQHIRCLTNMGYAVQTDYVKSVTPTSTTTSPNCAVYHTTTKKSNGSRQEIVTHHSEPLPHDSCGVCGENHATVDCDVLASLEPDQKVARLREKRLCFECLESGHTARTCDREKPVCCICHGSHHTILHGRSPPPPPSSRQPSNHAVAHDQQHPLQHS